MEPHSTVLGLGNWTDRPHWRRTSLCTPIALRKWGSAVPGTFREMGIIRDADKH